MTAEHPKDADAGGPGFAEAMAELEAILAEMEDDSVDVDVLSERVERAAELVRLCRERIAGARMEVEQIVAQIEGVPSNPDRGSAPTGSRTDTAL